VPVEIATTAWVASRRPTRFIASSVRVSTSNVAVLNLPFSIPNRFTNAREILAENLKKFLFFQVLENDELLNEQGGIYVV
jgi:hypothetical protein